MRALVVIALCGGCRGILGIGDPVLAADGPPDVADGSGDAPAACYGTDGWLLCFDAPPTGAITIAGSVDTKASALCVPVAPASWMAGGQPDACVVAGETVTVNADTIVSGERPLVVLAATKLRIDAALDVSSHRNMNPGPAANDMGCMSGDGVASVNGAGGGAGGSFVDGGGNGGNGSAAGGGIATATVAVPNVLRGGCPGGRGGLGGATSGGGGGDGGGAVFLVAGDSITITTSVNASGGGGRGASPSRGGGGGGGTGGMIVLFATQLLDVTGTLVANGGGGGEGASDTVAGNDGKDSDPANPLVGAIGGAGGSSSAGNGGAGAAGTSSGENGLNGAGGAGSGGGGGGGAVGVIRVLSNQSIAGIVSPPPVP